MQQKKKTYQDYLKQYEGEHQQPMTRLTHMIGIPMIVFSLVSLFFNWKIGVTLFVLGWVFQFVGHWVFERNNPAFFQGPMYLLMGVIWAFREWGHLLRWGSLKKRQKNGKANTQQENNQKS